jgi:hypothetical protein
MPNKLPLLKSILKEIRINEDDAKDELKRILKKDYVTFVKELGDNIDDPKFLAAIKSLSSESPVQTSKISPQCIKLKPTQNEVVLTKSLSYPLKNASNVESYLRGGEVAVDNRPIVTGGGGKFIIDGHHRWSQLYCINPYAKISAMDLTNVKKPMEALKTTQLGIGAELGEIPSAEGGGVNLFTIEEDVLKKYVVDNITDDVVQTFAKYEKGDTPEKIANYIWSNVQKMNESNQPVDNAPSREVMPQTDDAPDWKNSATNTEKLPESVGIKLKDLLKK